MKIGTPSAGAVIVCRVWAPSRVLIVPITCPSATSSPVPTVGSHQPASVPVIHRKRLRSVGDWPVPACGLSAMPSIASTPSSPRTCRCTASGCTRPHSPDSAVMAGTPASDAAELLVPLTGRSGLPGSCRIT
jgi:hypothetical protein